MTGPIDFLLGNKELILSVWNATPGGPTDKRKAVAEALPAFDGDLTPRTLKSYLVVMVPTLEAVKQDQGNDSQELTDLKGEIDRVKQELEQSILNGDQLTRELATARRELQAARDERDLIKAENLKMRQGLRGLQSDRGFYEKRIETVRQELNQELDVMRLELNTLRGEKNQKS